MTPPAFPMTRRIPEDQPYVVRPSAIKRGLAYAKIVSVLALVVSGPGALANISDPGTALLNMLGVVGFVLAISVLPLGPQLWLLSSGGPVLALSPAGLWIRTRSSRGQAIWLPWEAVAQIGRQRRGMENTLLIQPGDPRTVRQFGAATVIDRSPLSGIYGSCLTAPLNFADRPEEEILAAVRRFSAGRCPTNW